ncbi:DUF3653 domain-containing protein [Salinivibrio sp. PR919]|uniref:DUF3653 domain-containing protein n=1 Tax=Salinivibrio sp. PR919 TaxID=1909491 RepID=UPI000987C6BF|nr:DUF3653 domain-containing protein [Salinivibrio sp. PR919]OOF10888.1 S-adenosylhomocysteine hydrolase [Salinivibrio sp. PR919]
MMIDAFRTLFWREFDSINAGAQYFHVKAVTVKRWLDGTTPPNPMAEKLLIIKARGYLPNDTRWSGFRVDEENGFLVTPDGHKFNPKDLDAYPLWRGEYLELLRRHGHIKGRVQVQPPREHPKPFRGGRRCEAAPWIPIRDKIKK